MSPLISDNESDRVEAVMELSILDTMKEPEFDNLTYLASFITETPISLISLLDDKREWFKSQYGYDGADEIPKEIAFCAHAISNQNEMLIVPDSRVDERFHDNPLVVKDPHVVFYAGVPLVSTDGYAVGTLCVVDMKPKELDQRQMSAMKALANQVVYLFESRKKAIILKKTQNQLLEVEKMAALGILSAGIGHEINNPLNFISNGIREVNKRVGMYDQILQEQISPFVNIINEGVKRATDIVASLSHYSRKSEDFNEPCHINDIIDNIIIILNNQVKRDGIKIEKKRSNDTSLSIMGNEGKIHQAFLNILTNAIQAVKETQGKIIVSTFTVEEYAVVKIEDNGHGIKEEDLNRIKDPFFTTKPPGKGTGLGLYITHKIIAEHKGFIEVTSKVDEGTEFIIKLPTQEL